MVFGGSRQEIMKQDIVLFGTRQQSVPIILRELMLPEGPDPVSPSFTIRDVITKLYRPRLTLCRPGTYLQFIDHWIVIDYLQPK
ncbi:unnamed protein product [Schistosoma mattheei]|uniref:Uncharacterized protein n=1 Tax=Schistosoma mattheei TaxID=31246 RepID=A0A183PKP8_9TREM|nr:unnamed protein product [Schistosoma mattheei]